jgi:hypothetical protein
MKCNPCPLSRFPRPCLAETTRHWRLCALIDPRHRDHDPRYIPLLGGASVPAPGARATAPANPHLERLALVHACDYRGPKGGDCGCHDLRTCFAGRGPVSLADCLGCVQSPPLDRPGAAVRRGG